MHDAELETIARVVGTLAHDLNNLLAVMRGFGEIVREELGAEHPLGEDLDQILTAVTQGTTLTAALLAIAGKSQQEPETFLVDAHLEDLGDPLRGVTKSFGAPGVWVTLDPAQLGQAVAALLDNARDAMGAGGSPSVTTRADAEWVEIVVTDTGPGLDDAARARLFEPFFTTRGRPHRGLGLAVARGMIVQSGGTLEVASGGVGTGARAEIRLPRAPAR